MKRWLKTALYAAGVVAVLAVLLFLFRYPLMRFAGNNLIQEAPLAKADALFALGGNPYDRGTEAARLLDEGWAPVAYCTGESEPVNLAALDIAISEGELTAKRMVTCGTPQRRVIPIKKATSTWEESIALLELCQQQQFDTVIVLSDKFHTSRIQWVFDRQFAGSDIHVIVRGAPSTRYSEATWWESEYGLIMVNNEYIKKMYYWLKY